MSKERRRAARIACSLPSSFKDSGENHSWSSYFVSVKDLSIGGMRLKTHKPMPLSSKLNIAFVLPKPYHKTVTEAQVIPCWVSGAASDGYEVGVRFVHMSPEAKMAIRNSC